MRIANANTSKAARQNKGIKAKQARQTHRRRHKVQKERQLMTVWWKEMGRREREGEHNQGVARTALLFRASLSLLAAACALPRPAMPMQAHSTPLSLPPALSLSLSRWLRSASPKQSQLLLKRGTFLARKFNANCSSDASSDCDDDDSVTLRPFTSTRTCVERATENMAMGTGNGIGNGYWP